MIYADNAATTKLSKAAFDAMTPWLLDEYGNASQPYSFARAPKKALSEARTTIANCINAHPDEIFFTSGGTESDNWAIKGSAFFDGGRRTTITSSFEHHAVLHACASIERLGYPVAYLTPTAEGIITPQSLSNFITNNTRLVSIMYANNEIGSIQPIKELCRVAHASGALFHTDAVQAVGHIKIDVQDIGVDMLSASAHKFNGPKGVGFLYIRRGTQIAPYADGGAQEGTLRAGTENIASIAGMAVALKSICETTNTHIANIRLLEQQLLGMLRDAKIRFVRNGGQNTLPGLISLSFPGADGEAILHRMDLLGICISTGSACNGKSAETSHVLQAIDLDPHYAEGTIRISFGVDNTMEDVVAIGNALKKILER